MLRHMACLIRPCPEEKKLEELRAIMVPSTRRCPQRAGARENIAHRLFMRHAEKWRALPPGVRATFDGKARRHAHAVQERLRLDRELLMERIRAQRLVVEEAALSSRPLRIGDCRFTERDVTRFDATRIDPCFGGQWLRSFLADRVVDVGQPSVAEKHALLVNAGLDRVGFTVPEWSKVLCDHREIFRGALLQCRPYGGEVQYYVFLHGAKAPRKEACCGR